MTLLVLAFVAGVLTVLAPCILPLLPVIVGGSLAGDKKQPARPYIIAVSLAVSVLIFSLLLKASTLLIDVSPRTWGIASGSIIVVLGTFMVWPEVWERMMARLGLSKRSNTLLGKALGKQGWLGAVLTGAALGPVFTSCSPTYGFILATVLPKSFFEGFVYLVAYCVGLVLILLLISLAGQQLLSRHQWAVNPASAFRRGLGILFIIVGLLLISGLEKRFETWLVEHNPIDITVLEMKLFDKHVEQ